MIVVGSVEDRCEQLALRIGIKARTDVATLVRRRDLFIPSSRFLSGPPNTRETSKAQDIILVPYELQAGLLRLMIILSVLYRRPIVRDLRPNHRSK